MARFAEFKPHAKGIEKVLGGLEADIMEALWSRGRSAVRDVHTHLRATKHLAYTTVMTVMSRLATKGLLKRDMVGGMYYYEPAMTREEFTQRLVSQVIDSLLESFPEQTMAHLVTHARTDDFLSIERLAEVIEKRRTEKRE